MATQEKIELERENLISRMFKRDENKPYLEKNEIAKGNEEEEVEYIDIVTFIEELHPDLENTKYGILETNNSIPVDMRDGNPGLELLVKNELEDIESIMIISFLANLLDYNTLECILDSFQLAIDTQMFTNEELQKKCEGEKYHLILTSIYSELTMIEEPAKKMPSEFVKANLWCSTNADRTECYEEARNQILTKSAEISSIIERAQKIELKIEKDFDKSHKECLEGAVLRLDAIDKYAKESIQDCLLTDGSNYYNDKK